jgi:Zn-dependent peptidase ImmA (M78 family)
VGAASLSRAVGASAREIIEELVERLRAQTVSASARSLDRFLEMRKVIETRGDRDIGCDGYIGPIGASFVEGFRLVVNEDAPAVRQRFTIAHEICHTFFLGVWFTRGPAAPHQLPW